MDEDKECSISKQIEDFSVPIMQSVTKEEIEHFHHYNIRYYEDKYCIFNNTEAINTDVLLRFHTNRLILVSIAKGHDIFRQNQVIEKINFNVKGTDMSNISISGKKKAGAKKLKQNSILCYIKCKDVEKEYPVYACVPSSLIEINQHVLKDPQLLVTDYKGLGYIGILYPQRCNNTDKNLSKLDLLSEEEYENYLKSRNKSIDCKIVDS